MKKELEIWDNESNGFIKVEVTLKASKGFKAIFDYAKRSIVENFGKREYEPYWFEGLDVEGKDWFRGGWYNGNFGLINLSLKGNNVEGVILNGSKLYLLTEIKKIN